MAFSTYLLYVKTGGNWVPISAKIVKAEGYSVTPNQRMESSAARATTGYLSRTTCSHTASKIEFNTPDAMTNKEVSELNTTFSNAFTNALKRDITIKYYDPETDSYKEADCYMPDVEYPMKRIDIDENVIYYNSIRYAFIEY